MNFSAKDVETSIWQALSDRPDAVVELALSARKQVLKLATGCSEFLGETYCLINLFSFTGKPGTAFIHITTYAKHSNLGFNHGSGLDDPNDLLVGTGKHIRHIRLESKSQIKSKPIQALIANAVVNARELAESREGIQPARIGIRIGGKNSNK